MVRVVLRLNGVELLDENRGAMGHWNAEIHAAVAVELAMEMRWRLKWDVGVESEYRDGDGDGGGEDGDAAGGGGGAGGNGFAGSPRDAQQAEAAAEMVPEVW